MTESPETRTVEDAIADVEQRHVLKLRIAEAERLADGRSEHVFGTESAVNVARRVIADCKDSRGVIHEASLCQAITDVVVLFYRAQGRLPLFRDVVTGKLHD